jgi:ABC-type sugar transport system ATPase subunit
VTALEVQGLSKRYGDRTAVDDLSFSVDDGMLTCLVGPSGCGKTTVLRCVAGLLLPDSGRIAIGGRVVFGSSPRVHVRAEDRRTGLVFQDYALWPHMNVRQHLRFPMESQGLPKSQQDHDVTALLDLVQLQQFGERRPSELSGGQQQRVALARALACAPKLLLMDEPMSNLDARLRQQMRGDLVRLLRNSGAATLYVTHDQTEAMSIADQIVILRDGRLIQRGTPADVYERPADLGVAEFLGIGPAVGAQAGDRPCSALLGSRLPLPLNGFETDSIGCVVVPVSAVHPADVCSGAASDLTLPAEIRSVSYEGGSWLVEAALVDGAGVVQFRSEHALPTGSTLPLHLVPERLLPFSQDGGLCPQAAPQAAPYPAEVII